MKLFSKNILLILLILMVMAGVYSLLAGQMEVKNEIPISQIVSGNKRRQHQIHWRKRGQFGSGFCRRENRPIQKEAEASLTDTLMNYGVSAEQLAKVSVDIKSPSSSSVWLGTVLPLALPILIIVFFFWMAARQVKNQIFSLSLSAKPKLESLSRTTKKKKSRSKMWPGRAKPKKSFKKLWNS